MLKISRIFFAKEKFHRGLLYPTAGSLACQLRTLVPCHAITGISNKALCWRRVLFPQTLPVSLILLSGVHDRDIAFLHVVLHLSYRTFLLFWHRVGRCRTADVFVSGDTSASNQPH